MRLYDYAKAKFHELDDRYRRYMSDRGERVRQEYDAIVANGDLVSKHSFELPEDVCNGNADGGRRYVNHLYVDETGVAVIRLNDWEDGVPAARLLQGRDPRQGAARDDARGAERHLRVGRLRGPPLVSVQWVTQVRART